MSILCENNISLDTKVIVNFFTMFSLYTNGDDIMNFELKQKVKLTMPRHKKAFYGFYVIAAVSIVVLSLVL